VVAGRHVVEPGVDVRRKVGVRKQHEHVDVAELVSLAGAKAPGQPQSAHTLVGREVAAHPADQVLL